MYHGRIFRKIWPTIFSTQLQNQTKIVGGVSTSKTGWNKAWITWKIKEGINVINFLFWCCLTRCLTIWLLSQICLSKADDEKCGTMISVDVHPCSVGQSFLNTAVVLSWKEIAVTDLKQLVPNEIVWASLEKIYLVDWSYLYVLCTMYRGRLVSV